MVFTDFVVRWDESEGKVELSKRIIYSLFIRRTKLKKPAIAFVSGDSGEGKSYSVLTLEKTLLELLGLELKDYLDAINVYTPLEYPTKLKALLFDKKFKPVNIIAMHEARDIVKAKKWSSFLSIAVADINAQVRSVKRLIVFVVSQFIRDITTDMRYTLTYYITCRRAMGGDKKVRMQIFRMWKDDRDLEKPRLRKRKISGYIVDAKGKRRRFTPKFFLLSAPDRELAKAFDKSDREAKASIIKGKIERLISDMKTELEDKDKKVLAMVKFYTENPDSLLDIGRRNTKGDFKVNKAFKDMHDISSEEAVNFEVKLNERLKEVVEIE